MEGRSASAPYFTVAAVTLAAGLAAYALYFDYKRRNDTEFRRKLRKKRVQKTVEQTMETEAASTTPDISPEMLRDALLQAKNEEGPKSPVEKENYFMTQVGIGEQLAAQGPNFYLPAAMAFFRALRVYPSPVELIVIYQKTIIEPVFKLIMEMTNMDVSAPTSPLSRSMGLDEETSPTRGPPSEASSQEWDKVKVRIEAYYDHFPPKRTNVSISTRENTSGQGSRQVLVVDKDFTAGSVIYKEFPVVAALDLDLQEKGTHCGHCLRPIQPEMSLQLPKDSSSSSFHLTYCSRACMIASKNQSHTLLFTLDSPLPSEIPSAPTPPEMMEARKTAQAKFVEYLKKENRAAPLLVASFIARQVALETQKMVEATNPGKKASADFDFTDTDNQDDRYALADHMERLRYLEVVPNPEELGLLCEVLKTALPGLEEFATEERHMTLSGKMAYNAFGVCFGGGRDDRPEPKCRPEEVEKSRTPYGTHRQIGTAIYTLSSYLTHSCQPSARPSFSSGTAEISIIANRDLKKGDELTIAFVDVTQHPDESVVDCRRRRRVELARGWRFACGCERCVEEGKAMTVEEEKGGLSEEQQKDGSKVENVVKTYAPGQGDAAEDEGVE
ncbi:hypothetical protein B0H34DRAFT_780452 [Crassisporium funariophilum]|nr:hypothetical protein B0H34DRAFT_780452 [Crassisporium funariophilum]